MRIAVMGSGGLGGYFGARLAPAARTCTSSRAAGTCRRCARWPSHRRSNTAPHARVNATDDPRTIGSADLVMLCVKLWDTEPALRRSPARGPGTAIISFQNGVLKDQYLRAAFNASQLMGGVGYVATTIDRPGVIRQTGPMQRLLFGEFDGGESERGNAFLAACLAGGIKRSSPEHPARDLAEVVFLVGLSGTTTTMRRTIGPIRENPQTRTFLLDVMREVVAVGRAQGVDLAENYAEVRLQLADDVAYDMTSSMHHDLERGNRLEVRWLSGGVVELGDGKACRRR